MFRRAPSKTTTVSVIPARNSDKGRAAEVQAWKKEVDVLDKNAFIAIFNEVQ